MAGPYTAIDLEDQEFRENRSSSDASSATAMDDKEWTPPAARSRKSLASRIISTIKAWRWLIDIALLLVIVYLLLENRAYRASRDITKGATNEEKQIASDPSGFAPRISQHIRKFIPDLDFVPEEPADYFSNKTQQKWLDLVPKGLGYVQIDNPEQFDGLPTPLTEFNESTVFTTSVTHQLHCLHSIVQTFNEMRAYPHTPPSVGPWHMGHCFEYLRQAIMCAGDTTLEGQATTFPDGVDGSDGWDAMHVCKDYSQIFHYLEDNRVNDKKWI